MKKQDRQALIGLDIQELKQKLESLRHELFTNRLHGAARPLKDTGYFKRTRKDIARLLTVIRQKEA